MAQAHAAARGRASIGSQWKSIDQPTLDGLKMRLGAAGIAIDAIPGGFAAMDPWGTRIRFTVAP